MAKMGIFWGDFSDFGVGLDNFRAKFGVFEAKLVFFCVFVISRNK